MTKFNVVLAIKIINIEAKSAEEAELLARKRVNDSFQKDPTSAFLFTAAHIHEQQVGGLTADEFFTDEERAFFENTQSADDFNPDIVKGRL